MPPFAFAETLGAPLRCYLAVKSLALVKSEKRQNRPAMFQELTRAISQAPMILCLQSIYVMRDRVILKFEARVQIYVVVLNFGCEIQNSTGNVVSFSKINSCEYRFSYFDFKI